MRDVLRVVVAVKPPILREGRRLFCKDSEAKKIVAV